MSTSTDEREEVMEAITKVVTARDLLTALQNTPDYMLDIPIECEERLVDLIEVIDQIEEGNRVTMIRISCEDTTQ